MATKDEDFDKGRTKRVIASSDLLKKVWAKQVKAARYDEDTLLKAFFRSIILPDSSLLEIYKRSKA